VRDRRQRPGHEGGVDLIGDDLGGSGIDEDRRGCPILIWHERNTDDSNAGQQQSGKKHRVRVFPERFDALMNYRQRIFRVFSIRCHFIPVLDEFQLLRNRSWICGPCQGDQGNIAMEACGACAADIASITTDHCKSAAKAVRVRGVIVGALIGWSAGERTAVDVADIERE